VTDEPLREDGRPGTAPEDRVSETVRLLIVEDDEDDFLITRDLLADQDNTPVEVEWAEDYEQGLEGIRGQRHDVYLVDYRLGERTGLELIREAFASRPSAPVIMLTGQANQDIDLEATALGATGFLTKQGLSSEQLERAIRYAIRNQKAERYALAARASEDGIWDWDLTTDRLYLSPRWHAILGRSEQASDVQSSAWFELVSDEDVSRLRGER
jgi:DNA-binding NtrC family response regulator